MRRLMETRRVFWLRAGDAAPSATADRCTVLGAQDWDTGSFCDTCFRGSYGGVTLRERANREAHLVYTAEPAPSPGEAFYHLVAVKLPEPVIDALLRVAELRGVVALKRRTLTWEGAEIHLDAVEGLGQFIEVEVEVAIGERPGAEPPRARLEQLRQALDIDKESLVTEDYAELLSARPAALPKAR